MKIAIVGMLVSVVAAQSLADEIKINTDNHKIEVKGMTIRDCIDVNTGLNQIDAGKFKLPDAMRDIISHDMFLLDSVLREAQAANRRIQMEIRGESQGELNQSQLLRLEIRINEYLDRPCIVGPQLDRIKASDLDKAIPSTAIKNIWQITDR